MRANLHVWETLKTVIVPESCVSFAAHLYCEKHQMEQWYKIAFISVSNISQRKVQKYTARDNKNISRFHLYWRRKRKKKTYDEIYDGRTGLNISNVFIMNTTFNRRHQWPSGCVQNCKCLKKLTHFSVIHCSICHTVHHFIRNMFFSCLSAAQN